MYDPLKDVYTSLSIPLTSEEAEEARGFHSVWYVDSNGYDMSHNWYAAPRDSSRPGELIMGLSPFGQYPREMRHQEDTFPRITVMYHDRFFKVDGPQIAVFDTHGAFIPSEDRGMRSPIGHRYYTVNTDVLPDHRFAYALLCHRNGKLVVGKYSLNGDNASYDHRMRYSVILVDTMEFLGIDRLKNFDRYNRARCREFFATSDVYNSVIGFATSIEDAKREKKEKEALRKQYEVARAATQMVVMTPKVVETNFSPVDSTRYAKCKCGTQRRLTKREYREVLDGKPLEATCVTCGGSGVISAK